MTEPILQNNDQPITNSEQSAGGFEFKDIRQPEAPQSTIGELLKKARLEKGVDFDKIYETTKIRRAYIEALENNDFRKLPNLLVARGYMKVYAEFLGLKVDEFIDRFNQLFPEEATGSNGPRNPKERDTKFDIFIPKEMLVPNSLRNMNASGFRYSQEFKGRSNKKLIYSIGLAVGFIFFSIFLSNLYFKNSIGSIKSTPRQITEVSNLEAKITPEAMQAMGKKYNKVSVLAKASARCYLMVVMDGRLVFRGNLEEGNSKYWEADQYIRLKASVPRNLNLVVNGEDLGVMDQQINMLEKTYYPLKPGETTGNATAGETAQPNAASAPAAPEAAALPAPAVQGPAAPQVDTQTYSAPETQEKPYKESELFTF